MAQYYTLDEAAQKLGLTTEAFRRKLATEWKTTPRRYPDGATLRFQVREIDELARSLGQVSEPDLQLDAPLKLADDTSSEDFIPLSGAPSSGRLPKTAPPDSDVRLGPPEAQSRPASPRPGSLPTEEIDLDAEQKAKPPSSKRLPKGQTQAMTPPAAPKAPAKEDGSSDFDLTLTPDSSDEFELKLTDDDSDEVDIGVMPVTKGLAGGDSGINLQAPADSGISLEKSSSEEFELAPEESSSSIVGPKSGPKSGPKTAPKTGPLKPQEPGVDESSSEFELSLDEGGAKAADADATTGFTPEGEQKDIFETDFELPALDDESGSEQVAMESDTDLESSDFDLAIDEGDAAADEESGSQVVAIDEDEEAPRRGRRAAVADEDELDELDVAEDLEEEDEYARPAVAAEPAEWGALPAIVLIPCVLVMFVVGLMSWELLHGMWGYNQPGRAASPIVRGLAETFGEKLPAE
jgi:hypothetical protein